MPLDPRTTALVQACFAGKCCAKCGKAADRYRGKLWLCMGCVPIGREKRTAALYTIPGASTNVGSTGVRRSRGYLTKDQPPGER